MCQQFAHHLDETAGNPSLRLERTMWEGLTPDGSTPSVEDE
jgi:hypothetical protein